MNFPFFASIIVFLLVLGRAIKKNTHAMEEEQQSFWQKERASNSVRKKPLDNLDYISIPLEQLPLTVHLEDSVVQECVEIIQTLATCKIVNLTGISNTDLKLTYGTANITALSEYDQNYTLLATTLQKWADKLISLADISSAQAVLEYAVSTNTDVSKTYLMLADIYTQQGSSQRISELITVAEKLTTPSGRIIIRKLQDIKSPL